MGFRRAVVPADSGATGTTGIEVIEAGDVREALRAALRD
jgi:hypothetical protein